MRPWRPVFGIGNRRAVLGAVLAFLAIDDRRRRRADPAAQRPRSAGLHISTMATAGKPSANNWHADLTSRHADTHTTRSSRRAIHFRPLAVGSIVIRTGALAYRSKTLGDGDLAEPASDRVSGRCPAAPNFSALSPLPNGGLKRFMKRPPQARFR